MRQRATPPTRPPMTPFDRPLLVVVEGAGVEDALGIALVVVEAEAFGTAVDSELVSVGMEVSCT